MSVPDYRHVPQKLYATGLYDLHSEIGQGAFTDAVVSTLNGIDPNFRHLKKKKGQSQLHGHGEDSVLYLLPDNKAQAVDFIGGAGGSNPQPGWIVDEIRYTHADAHDPDDHGIGTSAPVPPPVNTFPYPDENTTGKAFQNRVRQAYTDANRRFPDPFDEDAFRHFQRYGYSSHEMPEPQAADKHIKELRDQLGV